MKNPSIFGSSQKRGVLIPICSRFESVTFRESEAILTLPEVCQQSEPVDFFSTGFVFDDLGLWLLRLKVFRLDINGDEPFTPMPVWAFWSVPLQSS
ncbi:hypothetical protein [Brucella vulpis]|uniref:hypothetical protein n=1 Tax=Brucella vulpis TaxID=981386 RepID=UPI00073A5E51|nr:hypothetical protein BF3285c2_0298 [Brucella vulpis]